MCEPGRSLQLSAPEGPQEPGVEMLLYGGAFVVCWPMCGMHRSCEFVGDAVHQRRKTLSRAGTCGSVSRLLGQTDTVRGRVLSSTGTCSIYGGHGDV